ncbi:putative enzyme [uncultured Alphaproteobacteria bacterium]|uniref:Putative enzyme n=1 Tax=uncultured Alphaproteobacteria bacterium TaxID=91750 RepID=A0A212JHS4_9PROT|nr:putative enzyme [uncultured Alphaproteobacteria bacterium]
MPVTIRPARADEAETAVALWRACNLVVPTNDPVADFHRARDRAASDVLLALAGEAIVGSAMVGHDGHRGWIYYLAVDPARRGEGIGRALVAAAEAWVKARGVPKIQLLVRRSNAGVMGFYQGFGYAETPTAVMQKVLIPYSAD